MNNCYLTEMDQLRAYVAELEARCRALDAECSVLAEERRTIAINHLWPALDPVDGERLGRIHNLANGTADAGDWGAEE